MVRDQVSLTSQLRYPKTVIGISGKQPQERRCRMGGIVDGNVELVGGDDAKLWVTVFPPKLMADYGNFHGVRRLRSILHGVEHPCRRQEQYDHNQNGDNRPGQFDLRTSIHLCRLTVRTR